jgi:DNA-binding NarL/FixJ family response regulator
MDILIFTDVRVFGEGLERCLRATSDISVVAIAHDLASLRDMLDRLPVDVVLVDITQGFSPDEFRRLAADYPGTVLMALGLREQEDEVIRCGQAGFAGYIPRDASVETLSQRMLDARNGRLTCPEQIAAGLMKALYRGRFGDQSNDEMIGGDPLTKREASVARLVGSGMSNKEIARELTLSVATVKHHVHSILAKLQLPSRNHIIRRERDVPRLAAGTKASLRRSR